MICWSQSKTCFVIGVEMIPSETCYSDLFSNPVDEGFEYFLETCISWSISGIGLEYWIVGGGWFRWSSSMSEIHFSTTFISDCTRSKWKLRPHFFCFKKTFAWAAVSFTLFTRLPARLVFLLTDLNWNWENMKKEQIQKKEIAPKTYLEVKNGRIGLQSSRFVEDSQAQGFVVVLATQHLWIASKLSQSKAIYVNLSMSNNIQIKSFCF